MNIKKLKEQLIEHEGLRLKPYKCSAGYLTIGVGRNLKTRGITEDEAIYLLDNDIEYYTARTRDLFPRFDDLSDTRQRVLVDMCFNIGYKGLSGFYKMRKAIEDEDYTRAAQEMLDSRWAAQVGKRAVNLSNMMIKGSDLI